MSDFCLKNLYFYFIFTFLIIWSQVRNVEYKNPVEEEWDRYLKEIKEETTQSAQIIAEDHELATSERQINEIDEQLGNLSR